ncbi:hypothetical protein SDC9_74181 [bioreactor metagenome]|uniref:Uncharacterized protein n=1 Tax=bioreactor metagenome TaxID=1076179 RepID=A0A644YI51_9ZZZZ
MHPDPERPGDEAGERQRRAAPGQGDLGDGRVAADGGHRALVPVLEALQLPAPGQRDDLTGDVHAHLHRGLGQLRQRLVLDDRAVAGGEDPVLALHPQHLIDDDPAATAELEAQAAGPVVRPHTGAPDDHVTLDHLTTLEDDVGGVDLGDRGVEPDVDVTLDHLVVRVLLQLVVERAEQHRAGLDQVHLDPLAIQLGVHVRDPGGAHLRQRAGHLDTGRAAADHDDVQVLAGPLLGRHRGIVLEAPEDRVAAGDGLGPGVHRQGVLGHPGQPEEVDRHTEAEDQVLVVERAPVLEPYGPQVRIDRGDGAADEPDARVLAGEVAQRIGHVARIETTGRDLVQQGLEGVVRMPVDKGDTTALAGELPGRLDPCETGTDDDDMWPLIHHAIVSQLTVGGHPRPNGPEELRPDRRRGQSEVVQTVMDPHHRHLATEVGRPTGDAVGVQDGVGPGHVVRPGRAGGRVVGAQHDHRDLDAEAGGDPLLPLHDRPPPAEPDRGVRPLPGGVVGPLAVLRRQDGPSVEPLVGDRQHRGGGHPCGTGDDPGDDLAQHGVAGQLEPGRVQHHGLEDPRVRVDVQGAGETTGGVAHQHQRVVALGPQHRHGVVDLPGVVPEVVDVAEQLAGPQRPPVASQLERVEVVPQAGPEIGDVGLEEVVVPTVQVQHRRATVPSRT